MSCKAESSIWTEAMNCVDRVAKSSTLDVNADDLAFLWDECDYPVGSTELEACLVVFNNNLKTREPEMQRIATMEKRELQLCADGDRCDGRTPGLSPNIVE